MKARWVEHAPSKQNKAVFTCHQVYIRKNIHTISLVFSKVLTQHSDKYHHAPSIPLCFYKGIVSFQTTRSRLSVTFSAIQVITRYIRLAKEASLSNQKKSWN